MTEIRPIRESEADTFLDLLCGVFDLDPLRARGVFFTEPFYELARKWALFEGPEMVSILTTTPLEFGWGRAYGIAGVATRPERRGEGHASQLLERVFSESEKMGEGAGLLFAKDPALYQRNGFEPIDRVIRASIATCNDRLGQSLEHDSIKGIYNEWASHHPDRLRRSGRRWGYWLWHYRICSPYQGGYICNEPGVLREVIINHPQKELPVPAGTEWFGTTSMADRFGIPLVTHPRLELYLMARNVPGVPQMFMTDQF